MAKNVVGLFDTVNDAQGALQALRDAGFSGNDISFVGNNANNQYGDYSTTDGTETEAAEGAGFGATGGAVLGGLAGLLVGLGALAIPGIGPVIAAGTLATTLGTTALGAGLGAAAGGLTGALVGAGIPEQDANIYSEGIRRGGALVSVQVATDEEANRAADIMDQYNVVDIDSRGAEYRQSGWTGFSDNAEPYSSTSYGATSDTSYGTTSDASYSGTGDADKNIGMDDYDRSSKVGTATGGVAGAAAGAAIGAAGGPVGAVVGGVAGALTGGGVGAAGDAAGAEATDEHSDRTSSYDTTSTTSGTSYGSVTDTTSTSTYGTTGLNNTSLDQAGEVKVPIVEEELRVGKREVEGGGVRVTSRVEETPVNEQVTLREETIDVHRRPVDRPVSDADLTNFQEGTFEVRERDEEAIVDKQARVVEEVHIKKNVEERNETIQDTVRRTDVDVEELSGRTRTSDYTDTTSTAGYTDSGIVSDEGTIERGASNLGNSIESGTGLDIDRDGDVGQRDTRNNY